MQPNRSIARAPFSRSSPTWGRRDAQASTNAANRSTTRRAKLDRTAADKNTTAGDQKPPAIACCDAADADAFRRRSDDHGVGADADGAAVSVLGVLGMAPAVSVLGV